MIEAVRHGAHDLSGVRAATEAATGCGDCAYDVEDLIDACRTEPAAPTARN
ncbi:(2Fe-2S)-binding protein [Streptomyces sp. NPDC054863]